MSKKKVVPLSGIQKKVCREFVSVKENVNIKNPPQKTKDDEKDKPFLMEILFGYFLSTTALFLPVFEIKWIPQL